MDVKFACRFIQDWDYTKNVYAQTRRSGRPLLFWWYGLAFFTFLLMVDSLFIQRDLVFAPLHLILFLFTLWKGFGGPLRIRRRWKKTCKQRGKDCVETVFQFGDKTRVSDDSGVAIEFSWEVFEKAYRLKDMGPYLKFQGIPRQKGNLYLPKSGFEDGNGETFLAWIREEHPALLRR